MFFVVCALSLPRPSSSARSRPRPRPSSSARPRPRPRRHLLLLRALVHVLVLLSSFHSASFCARSLLLLARFLPRSLLPPVHVSMSVARFLNCVASRRSSCRPRSRSHSGVDDDVDVDADVPNVAILLFSLSAPTPLPRREKYMGTRASSLADRGDDGQLRVRSAFAFFRRSDPHNIPMGTSSYPHLLRATMREELMGIPIL